MAPAMSSIANGSIDRQDIADVDNGGTRNSKNIRGPRTRPRLRENGSAPAASHQDDRRKLRGSDDEDDESLDGLDAWGGGADDPFGEEEAAQELVASRRRDGARMPGEMATWSGRPAIKGSSEAVRMVLLNFCTIGITFTWGIEMTYCTPYLLSLGLTKSNTSLVWIAGPLSGLIVQPVVGVIADQSRSKWGRRRPIIVIGALVVACALLVLGFTKELVEMLISPESGSFKAVTIAVAVLALYCTDFAINAVMSCARSLVVDTLPIQKQQAGAAWSSRMGSIGHVIGYGAGAIDLVSLFGTTLGDTQFKQLTVIAATFILFSCGVTCWAVSERVLVSARGSAADGRGREGNFKVARQIWSTLLNLPSQIQAICWIVFWSWIGWFPFLFYSTTWVGETYFRYDVPADARDSGDALGDIGRIGSTSLVIYSCITFTGAFVLPLLIRSPDDNEFTHRPPESIARIVEKFNQYKPSLLTAWMCGHLMFSGAMILAPFARGFRFATFLVAICGIPWTIAMWAPAAFLGVEVNKMAGANTNGYHRLSTDIDLEMVSIDRVDRDHDEPDVVGGSSTAASSSSPQGELSGIYFGILNIYTTLPQFVGTFLSTIVFAILEPGKSPELALDAHPSEHHSTDGPNAISVCLFLGALSTLGAAYATWRLRKL